MRLYLIPGYGGAANTPWLEWLRARYEPVARGSVIVPLPDPFHPNADAWIGTLRREIGTPDAETYFVAHSLGCITLLRFLEQMPADTRVGGVVLVAGFAEHLDRFPKLDVFTGAPLAVAHLRALATLRLRVIGSPDDSHVPIGATTALAERLGTPLFRIERAGHFQATDGWATFPLVAELLDGWRTVDV